MPNGVAASTLKRHSSDCGSSTEPKRPPRNFDLCQYCRSSKKPCLPVERNWEAGQRCNNCVQRNLPCGPSLRVRGRRPAGCGGNVVGVCQPQLPAGVNPYLPSSLSLPPAASAALLPALARPSLLPKPSPSPIRLADNTEKFSESDLFSQHTNFVSVAEGSHDAPPGRIVHPSEPTHAEIIQKELNNGEIELHRISQSFYDIIRSEQAVGAALASQAGGQLSNPWRTSPSRVFDRTCVQFVSTLGSQLRWVKLAPSDQQEVRLRRLLDFVRPFYQQSCICTNRSSSAASLDRVPGQLTEAHCSILLALVRVCDKAGNTWAADNFCKEYWSLPLGIRPREDDAAIMRRFDTACQALSNCLDYGSRELDLDCRENSSHDSVNPPFSSGHIAVSPYSQPTVVHPIPLYIEDDEPHYGLRRNALHIAIQSRRPDLLKSVLEKNNDALECRDLAHMTPLLLAAAEGNLEMFKVLYESGANKMALDVVGRDILVLSSERGHDSIVNFLLGHGMHPSRGYDDPRYSPLYAASKNGYHSTVSLLLENGAYPLQPSLRQTPKQVANLNNHYRVSKLLSDAEARWKSISASHPVSDHSFHKPAAVWASTSFGASSDLLQPSEWAVISPPPPHLESAGPFAHQSHPPSSLSSIESTKSLEPAVASDLSLMGTITIPGCKALDLHDFATAPSPGFTPSSQPCLPASLSIESNHPHDADAEIEHREGIDAYFRSNAYLENWSEVDFADNASDLNSANPA